LASVLRIRRSSFLSQLVCHSFFHLASYRLSCSPSQVSPHILLTKLVCNKMLDARDDDGDRLLKVDGLCLMQGVACCG